MQFRVTAGLPEKPVQQFVAAGVLAVEEAEVTDVGPDGEFNGGDVVGVPPVFPDREGVLVVILRVHDEQIGVPAEINERIRCFVQKVAMLRVRRVHHGLAAGFEPVAVGIAGMILTGQGDPETGYIVDGARGKSDEMQVRLHHVQRDGKERRRHLLFENGLDVRMPSVDEDAVAGDVGRREEGEALNMVPVEMRHEDMKSGREGHLSPLVPFHDVLAEVPKSAARIANHEGVAAGNLYTGCVASESGPFRERYAAERRAGKNPWTVVGRGKSLECLAHLGLDGGGIQRGGKRAARSPEKNTHSQSSIASSGIFRHVRRNRASGSFRGHLPGGRSCFPVLPGIPSCQVGCRQPQQFHR